jgi:hypothetical protein
MRKLLLLLTVLTMVATFTVAASARTTTYSFTLRDTSGDAYCDGFTVYLYGSPKTLVDGYHWNDNCASAQTNVNGFKGGVAPAYQYSGSGAVLIVSDPLFGNGADGGSGLVWLFNAAYGTWIVYESGGGAGEYILNYGTFINGEVVKDVEKGTKPSIRR